MELVIQTQKSPNKGNLIQVDMKNVGGEDILST